MTYGLTLENEELITKKAMDKKDGIYTFRGVTYLVKSGIVKYYATNNGDVLQSIYGFCCRIGRCDFTAEGRKRALKKIGGE